MSRIKPHVLVLGLFLVGLGLLGWAIFAGRPSARGQGPNPNPTEVTASFSSSSYTVVEGNTATISVILNQASSGTVTVDWTASATLPDGSSYWTSGSIDFTPGVTQLTFEVAIPDDDCPQPTTTANLQLTGSTGATLGSPSTATVTILDNDT